jgi:UDP-3-O-[3-hydroxymyristoyl] glucosamine N-acyltransferase
VIRRGRATWRVSELAEALGLAFVSGRDAEIEGVASLGDAGPRDLAAVYDARVSDAARSSRAGALIVPPGLADAFDDERPLILSDAPKAALARAIERVHPLVDPARGVHPTAVVADDAVIGDGCAIGPMAHVGAGARLGERVVVGPGAVVLEGAEIGDDAELHPRVVVYPETIVGRRCRLLAGCVVGAPGFGHAVDEGGRAVRVPHLGRVVLEDDVEIGANATVDRATFGTTRLGERSRLDNLVQIGHNASVGADAMIAAQSGLSGSSELGAGCLVGGQSGLADHVKVGDRAVVAAKTAVFGDVEPGAVVAGTPAMPMKSWRRLAVIQAKLPEVWKDLLRALAERSANSSERGRS